VALSSNACLVALGGGGRVEGFGDNREGSASV